MFVTILTERAGFYRCPKESDSNNAQFNVITLEDNGSKLVPLEAAMEKVKRNGG